MNVSYLYTPALRLRSLAKNKRKVEADMVVIDLEDSIHVRAKDAARSELEHFDFEPMLALGIEFGVRINTLASREGMADIALLQSMAARGRGFIRAVFVPKVHHAAELRLYRSLLREIDDPPAMYTFLETLDAIENAYDIAEASDALCFGQADLVAEMFTPNDAYLDFARARLCAAAARHRIMAIDTNSFDIESFANVQRACNDARQCGFTGKAAIHPMQVPAINAAFRVSQETIDKYRASIRAYDESDTGFAILDGEVLAPPFIAKARRMLSFYDRGSDFANTEAPPVTTLTEQTLRDSFIDVSTADVSLADGQLTPTGDALVRSIVDKVERGPGVAVCHGVGRLLSAHGLDIHTEADAAAGRAFLEGLFRAAAERFDVAASTPVMLDYDRVAAMDVDGYNKNKNFTPNSDHTESREFVTTKCIHFDAATPFIANVHGPTENIRGGLPMIVDTRQFCADKGVSPAALVENIPNNYNVAVRAEHCDALLADYAFALDFDLADDMVMIVLYNEVDGGLAHAATVPERIDEDAPARRPIRHIEFQFATTDGLTRWYDHYDLAFETATDLAPEAMANRYHRGEAPDRDRLIARAS